MSDVSIAPVRRTARRRAMAVVAVLVVLLIAFIALRRRRVAEQDSTATEVPVHVAKVTRSDVHRYVVAFGTVTPRPASSASAAASARVASPIAGVVGKTLCAEGQRVKKDDVLFELDARTAIADEQKALAAKSVEDAKIARASAAADFAKIEAERAHTLLAQGIAADKDVKAADLAMKTSAQQVAEARAVAADAAKALEAARVRRSLHTIRAPLDGTVVRVAVNAGEAVDLMTVVAEIVDLDHLVVEAQLPAAELPSLRIGQVVELFAAGRADEATGDAGAAQAPQPGKIAFIGLAVDRKTDSVLVRIAFENPALRPGQYVRLRIAVAVHPGVLIVPAKSVVTTPDGVSSLWTVDANLATQRTVSIGIVEEGFVEVSGDAVREGVTVVSEGAYGLPAETRVRVGQP